MTGYTSPTFGPERTSPNTSPPPARAVHIRPAGPHLACRGGYVEHFAGGPLDPRGNHLAHRDPLARALPRPPSREVVVVFKGPLEGTPCSSADLKHSSRPSRWRGSTPSSGCRADASSRSTRSEEHTSELQSLMRI